MKLKNEEQSAAFRLKILQTAEELIQEEGIEKLSIRKITTRLQYTPGIIYHYFKNKDEILVAVTAKGYQNILRILASASTSEDPRVRLSDTLRAYIHGMCDQKDLFMIMMMSNDPNITSQVDLLKQGIRKERSSIHALCTVIEAGMKLGYYTCDDVELQAQVIWCSTFGLIQRICKEQIEESQKERLIEAHIHMIQSALMVKK